MSFLFLLILFGLLALGIGIGYMVFRNTRDRATPEEPPTPSGTHREPPKETAQRKAENES